MVHLLCHLVPHLVPTLVAHLVQRHVLGLGPCRSSLASISACHPHPLSLSISPLCPASVQLSQYNKVKKKEEDNCKLYMSHMSTNSLTSVATVKAAGFGKWSVTSHIVTALSPLLLFPFVSIIVHC